VSAVNDRKRRWQAEAVKIRAATPKWFEHFQRILARSGLFAVWDAKTQSATVYDALATGKVVGVYDRRGNSVTYSGTKYPVRRWEDVASCCDGIRKKLVAKGGG
jgi:hypothetical protein